MADGRKPIALTLGLASLGGEALEAMRTEDASSLSPLFETVKQMQPGHLTDADVLFVYADIDEDGSIGKTPASSWAATRPASSSR